MYHFPPSPLQVLSWSALSAHDLSACGLLQQWHSTDHNIPHIWFIISTVIATYHVYFCMFWGNLNFVLPYSDDRLAKGYPIIQKVWKSVVPFSGIAPQCSWTILTFQYWQTSSIRGTTSQHLHVSHLIFQLSMLNPLKPGVKSSMKMY